MQHDASYKIEPMQLEDIEEATAVRLQAWLDTYVNDEAGVSREWIEARNKQQRSDDVAAARTQRFLHGTKNGTSNGWVAKDSERKIIGVTTPYIDGHGIKQVGSLYVAKAWHGTGVAHDLMQQVMDWFGDEDDIELGVVAYNHRAQAFYRKWGFVKVSNSQTLFADKVPEIKMVRKANG